MGAGGSASKLQVTLTGPPEGTQIETGAPNQETFSGTVTPATDVGARVILQRQNAVTGDEWHRIGVGQVEAGGDYTITHIFRVPGDASIRVLVRSDGLNMPERLDAARVRDLPGAEPEPDDRELGRPDHLRTAGHDLGRARGRHDAADGHAARHGPSTSRASPRSPRSSTGAGGAYSFPAQAPVNSTLYRVQGAARREKSAVLYEGVKDVLTAEVSPTTWRPGRPSRSRARSRRTTPGT